LCSPTGASRFFHTDGELAVARAAARSGTLYSLSTASTFSIEEVAVASEGPKVFQLYICKDRDITRSLIERAKRSGYVALCITVDTPFVGKRERDLRAGAFGSWRNWPLSTIIDFARHPAWVVDRIGKGSLRLANFSDVTGEPAEVDIFTDQLDPSVTWKDIREVADLWGGPLALKGVMSSEDACRACDFGATAIMVSNHGGRQLDGAAAAFEILPEIARAVADRLEVILDGGIRRGVHVLKALACGAKACSIGRPYLYGLTAGGEEGVAKALGILRDELALAMQLSGCADLEGVKQLSIRRTA
jgi:L-lactate dehydrogenase (cytochrome)